MGINNYFNDLGFIFVDRRTSSGFNSTLLKNVSYSIEFIARGRRFLETNGKRQLLESPVAFWMMPENKYRFIAADDSPCTHYWADITGSRSGRMVNSLNQQIPAGRITISSPAEFTMIFEEMLRLHYNEQMLERYKCTVCLERLVGLILESSIHRQSLMGKHKFIGIVAEEMKKTPLKTFDFKRIARQNKLSYDHFRRLFKNYAGRSPYDYMLSCRMELAAEILRTREFQVKEVAYKCGFEDLATFSRMFKKKKGVSPILYLRSSK